MKVIITKTGRRHYYYEKGDEVKIVSEDTFITVESVDVEKKKIVDNTGVEYSLTTDIRPTVETLKNATVEDKRIMKTRMVTTNKIFFAKLREGAIIPSKRDEDGGYDVYALLSKEQPLIEIKPHEIKLIPTGLCSAFNKKYRVILIERGSSGTKGLARRCGLIDSGYRGEWFVAINNTTNKSIVIYNPDLIAPMNHDNGATLYPATKAICQAMLDEVPVVDVEEITLEQLKAIDSERGEGKIGDSGK